jgi:hypothetical protein
MTEDHSDHFVTVARLPSSVGRHSSEVDIRVHQVEHPARVLLGQRPYELGSEGGWFGHLAIVFD